MFYYKLHTYISNVYVILSAGVDKQHPRTLCLVEKEKNNNRANPYTDNHNTMSPVIAGIRMPEEIQEQYL